MGRSLDVLDVLDFENVMSSWCFLQVPPFSIHTYSYDSICIAIHTNSICVCPLRIRIVDECLEFCQGQMSIIRPIWTRKPTQNQHVFSSMFATNNFYRKSCLKPAWMRGSRLGSTRSWHRRCVGYRSMHKLKCQQSS